MPSQLVRFLRRLSASSSATTPAGHSPRMGRPPRMLSDLLVAGAVAHEIERRPNGLRTARRFSRCCLEAAQKLGPLLSNGAVSDGAARHAYRRTEDRCRQIASHLGVDPADLFWTVTHVAIAVMRELRCEEAGIVPRHDHETERTVRYFLAIAAALERHLSASRRSEPAAPELRASA